MKHRLPGLTETVRQALAEDIGTGDVTTLATIDPRLTAHGVFVAKSEGVVAGLTVLEEVFDQVDFELEWTAFLADGAKIHPGMQIGEVFGRAQSILIAERVALNFLQRLSGVATKTAQMVELVAGSGARVVDTRKTTPGLRALEKYAVRQGGGYNHRTGLYDAVMIKDNHIIASGGIRQALQKVHTQISHTLTVTVECDTLEQVSEAVAAGADIILLDNMSLEELEVAVQLINKQALAEASGGVNEQTITAIAKTGVDIISVGALTHSAPALDISLDLEL